MFAMVAGMGKGLENEVTAQKAGRSESAPDHAADAYGSGEHVEDGETEGAN
mgnify:CR=1 FL=1